MVNPRNWCLSSGSRGTYHVISRCSRRLFLMGDSKGYRRDWCIWHLKELLSGTFYERLAACINELGRKERIVACIWH